MNYEELTDGEIDTAVNLSLPDDVKKKYGIMLDPPNMHVHRRSLPFARRTASEGYSGGYCFDLLMQKHKIGIAPAGDNLWKAFEDAGGNFYLSENPWRAVAVVYLIMMGNK